MASVNSFTNTVDEPCIQEYLAILQRLLKQKAINIDLQLPNPNECTLEDLQSIVEHIFNGRLDAMIYQMAHKEILKNDNLHQHSKLLLKKLSPFQVMNFPQVILYKTLPCPRGDACPNRPREIAPSNQYKDEELECPFFHHEKDRRRLPITRRVEDEFIYKANYDKSKCDPFPDKFSKNYFESMFHPIYYRLFQCKRIHCENSFFCPFFHTKDEKTTWDETFLTYIRKSRDVYTKEKKEKTNTNPNSLRNIKDDFMNKYEIIAMDRKGASLSLPQSQMTLDRVSTHSSTNSSPSSHNELSPEPEKRTFGDWAFTQSPNMANNLASIARNTPAQQAFYGSPQQNLPPGLPNFPDGSSSSHPHQNNNFNNSNFPAGTFSLFGDYSSFLCEMKMPNNKDPKPNGNNPNALALNQFFNWQVLQNINNLRLHH